MTDLQCWHAKLRRTKGNYNHACKGPVVAAQPGPWTNCSTVVESAYCDNHRRLSTLQRRHLTHNDEEDR